MLPIIAQVSLPLLQALVSVGVSRGMYLNPAIDAELRKLSWDFRKVEVESKHAKDGVQQLRPCQYIFELVDSKARPMKKKVAVEMLDFMEQYRVDWRYAAKIDGVEVDPPSPASVPQPPASHKGSVQKWQDEWVEYMTEDAEERRNEYETNDFRKWLKKGKKQAPTQRLAEFRAASSDYLAKLKDDDYMLQPFCEVGFASDQDERESAHLSFSATNYLMALAANICLEEFNGDYKIYNFVLCHTLWSEQASAGEILFTAISGANHSSGHGFSHSPAGLTTNSVYLKPELQNRDLIANWTYEAFKEGSIIRHLDEEAQRCQTALNLLSTSHDRCETLEAEIAQAEVNIELAKQKRLENEIAALNAIDAAVEAAEPNLLTPLLNDDSPDALVNYTSSDVVLPPWWNEHDPATFGKMGFYDEDLVDEDDEPATTLHVRFTPLSVALLPPSICEAFRTVSRCFQNILC